MRGIGGAGAQGAQVAGHAEAPLSRLATCVFAHHLAAAAMVSYARELACKEETHAGRVRVFLRSGVDLSSGASGHLGPMFAAATASGARSGVVGLVIIVGVS